MRKVVALICSFFIISGFLWAQQMPHYSNYIMNNYLINPAVGGSYGFWNAKVGYRNQWSNLIKRNEFGKRGFNTAFATVHGPINYPDPRLRHRDKKPHHGVGGFVFSDITGPLKYNGGFVSYSFHKHFSRRFTASIGLNLGVKEFVINWDQVRFIEEPDDPLAVESVQRNVLPDANIGGFLYSDFMYFGITVDQLFRSRLTVRDPNNPALSLDNEARLRNHYFVTGGYKFEMTRDFFFYPSAMVEYVYGSRLQFDLNARFLYSDYVWLGIAYRNMDAVSLLIEYIVDDTWEIGYAFDMTFSELVQYHLGTHEIILGVRWANPKKQVMCPAKYW